MQLAHILFTAVNAVLPIILLILLGYFLKQKGFITKDFVKIGNKLVFKVCLPCMLFINVYNIESFSEIRWDIVGYAVAMILVIFVLGMITAVCTTDVDKRRGALWQCTFRSNFAIIGLSLAGALGGDEAMAVAAVLSAFSIPVFNILGVIALSVFLKNTDGKSHDVKNILLNIVKNPLIIGVTLGLICLGIRTLQVELLGEVVFALNRETKFLYTGINNLKAIASPFALIVLGGQFEFSAVKWLLKEIVVGTVWRIVLAPLLGIGGAILLSKYTNLLSCGVNEFPALIALFGSPVAVSSAVMAGSMGNDEQLATQLVVWTSICSIVTVFLIVCILMAGGLLVV
ncbi:MAG: AEC family transporter [Lachnospiraceae bacterium]|nr:AEC family transporter [Lachnospiraceae bacterium]